MNGIHHFGSPAIQDWTRSFASPNYSGFAFVYYRWILWRV